jgi:hypothetical protein
MHIPVRSIITLDTSGMSGASTDISTSYESSDCICGRGLAVLAFNCDRYAASYLGPSLLGVMVAWSSELGNAFLLQTYSALHLPISSE